MILDNIFKTIIFLCVLSILVLVHEFGHFIVGKLSGIGVLEFALGLPFTKPLWSKKLKNGMMLSFYPILFGGFVRLLGEEEDASSTSKVNYVVKSIKGTFFYKKPVWTRIAVVVAGVVMNFILAISAFYIFLAASGFHVVVPRYDNYQFISPHQSRVVLTSIQKGSPAGEAKIEPGSVLLSVDNVQIYELKKFQEYVKANAGKEIGLKYTNSSLTKQREVHLTPRLNPPVGQGALGVGLGEAALINFAAGTEKSLSGFIYGFDMFCYNWQIIGHLASQSFKTKDAAPLAESVSGPVGIYGIVGDIVDLGGWDAVLNMINFLGMMSLSLAFMNILPIPAMDGGKLFLLLIEALTRKKLSVKKENMLNQVGFALLIGLMLLISFNDISKFFRR